MGNLYVDGANGWYISDYKVTTPTDPRDYKLVPGKPHLFQIKKEEVGGSCGLNIQFTFKNSSDDREITEVHYYHFSTYEFYYRETLLDPITCKSAYDYSGDEQENSNNYFTTTCYVDPYDCDNLIFEVTRVVINKIAIQLTLSTYCICDLSADCDCTGIDTSCQCETYAYNSGPRQITIPNDNPEVCDGYVFLAPDSAYSITDIFSLYGLLKDWIKSGQIIYADKVDSFWKIFINMVNEKNKKLPSGTQLSYDEPEPSDIRSGLLIKASHFQKLADNIAKIHMGAPALDDGTGSGFTDPSGFTTKDTSDAIYQTYNTGDIIYASEVAKLLKWIGASMRQCVCNNNTTGIPDCCLCDIVCDCDYTS